MSAFCSVQIISLLFLQLILEAIKNGSKACRVSKLVFSSCVSHLTGGVAHWWVHSPDPVARVAQGSHPPLVTLLGSAGTASQWWCWGRLEQCPNPLGGSIPIFPPTHQLGSSSSPCSRLGQGNDSWTFSPLAWDAVRQVRQTFCLVHLIHSALWRKACRVCSDMQDFKLPQGDEREALRNRGSWISNNVWLSWMPWAEERPSTHAEELPVYPTLCQGSLLRLPWFAHILGVFSWGFSAL